MWQILIMLFGHFFMPLSLLYLQIKRHYRRQLDWLLMSLFTGSFCGLFFIAGLWHWFGPVVRYTIPLLYVGAVGYSFARVRQLPFWKTANPREWFGFIFVGLMTALLSFLLIWSWRGQSIEKPYLRLAFPLRNGNFYVTEGGDAPVINSMHTYPDIARKYGVDLVKLGKGGWRAAGLSPSQLTDYYIFGEPVLSPMNGVVKAVVDSFPDQVGTNPDTSVFAEYGNRIEIARGDTVVTLAFLRRGSIVVNPGDTVSRGDLLAEVGASGDAGEPTLRIFAFLDRDNPPWGWGWGIPMVFGRAFLYRNFLIADDQ
ncbi:MAG TPA: M23 family metallopeptidase [Calditrichia bacterium]|nr:M23 family metallopeptidase [Calditrichia bacterium]